jgi:hypothetical protein
MHALGPATANQIGAASFLIRECPLEFSDGHLMDGLEVLAGHDGILPSDRMNMPCQN